MRETFPKERSTKSFADLTREDLMILMREHVGEEPKGTVADPILWPVGRHVWKYFRGLGMGPDGRLNGGTVRVFIPRKMPVCA